MNTSSSAWQQALNQGFSDLHSLCQHLQIDPQQLPLLDNFRQFPLKVPRQFVDCMEPGNPDDPLLRQILPLQQELLAYPGYHDDPVGDLNAVAAAGVIHKYHGRILLITTGACAVHCRYCFRRNFPYGEQQLSTQKQQQALAFIQQHQEISEVILSGGDPLLLNDSKLGQLITDLSGIAHLKRIRIHSRVPVVLPSRITPELIDLLTASDKKIILVLHSNHANELSDLVASACLALQQRQISLLNQSVLLKAVNDDAESLRQLSEKLFSLGVLPYYLHQLDQARGTAHFAVDDATASHLITELRSTLPGYLVPKLVREQAGAAYKLNLC